MIWIVTIATFLTSMVFFALIFFVYSKRGRIRDAFRNARQLNHEKRTSTRTTARVKLELSSLAEALIHEIAITDNVSHHGARVRTKNRWEPFENVQVRFVSESALAQARIAYSNPSGNGFATGLEFSVAISPWIGPHKPST